MVELLELTLRHIVHFWPAEGANKFLPLVERQRLQVETRPNDMWRQKDQQVLLRRTTRIVAYEIAKHRNVGEKRDAATVFLGLARQEAADHRGAIVLNEHRGRGRPNRRGRSERIVQ